jgi:hypothetical protein
MLSYDVWDSNNDGPVWLGYLSKENTEERTVWLAYAAPHWGMRLVGGSFVLVDEYLTEQDALEGLREYWGLDV